MALKTADKARVNHHDPVTAFHLGWRQAWIRREGHGRQGTCPRFAGRYRDITSPGASLPDYAPIPRSALGPALNDQGYYVGRVERNLYWVTDGVYQSAFLTTRDGVVLFDAPPTHRQQPAAGRGRDRRRQRRDQHG